MGVSLTCHSPCTEQCYHRMKSLTPDTQTPPNRQEQIRQPRRPLRHGFSRPLVTDRGSRQHCVQGRVRSLRSESQSTSNLRSRNFPATADGCRRPDLFPARLTEPLPRPVTNHHDVNAPHAGDKSHSAGPSSMLPRAAAKCMQLICRRASHWLPGHQNNVRA